MSSLVILEDTAQFPYKFLKYQLFITKTKPKNKLELYKSCILDELSEGSGVRRLCNAIQTGPLSFWNK